MYSENVAKDTLDIQSPKFDPQSGKNTQRAIQNASQALQVARKLEDDDETRDWWRSRIMAAFTGNAPFDEDELMSIGQSYRFNVSFGFMEGVIGRSVAPYMDLVNDSQYIANIDADLPDEKLNIMRESVTEVIKRWGKWPKMTSRLIQDLVLNGYNTVVWPSDFDPFPIFVPQKDSFVHEMTPNDVSDLELYVWRRSYMIHELYKYISDEEAARKAGWNIEIVRKAIENAVPKEILRSDNRRGGWVEVESAIRGGALWSSVVGGKEIKTYHVFAAELSGKVTHYICWDGKHETSEVQSNQVELFKKEDRFESFEDMLVYFDLESGDGHWHGSRGLGRRTYNAHRSQDKLRCALLDQSFTSGLTILQPKDQESQEQFNLAVVGPFAVIPAGMEVSATTVPSISTTAFQVDALLSTTVEQRIGDVVPSVSTPTRRGNQTATAATIANERANMISKSNLIRFIDPLSKMISIIVRRLLKKNSPDKYAKAFQEELINHGFTEEDFLKVRGAKSTGRIEAVMGNDRTNYTELLATYRGDPDVNQKILKERHLTAVIGPKEISGIFVEAEDQTVQVEAARMQLEEIASNISGINVPVSPRDNHEIHAQIGIQWMMQQIQMTQQGGKGAPMPVLDLVGNHVGQHVQMLKADKMKADLAGQLENQLKQIANAIDQMQQAAQKTIQNQLTASAPSGTVQEPSSAPSMISAAAPSL